MPEVSEKLENFRVTSLFVHFPSAYVDSPASAVMVVLSGATVSILRIFSKAASQVLPASSVVQMVSRYVPSCLKEISCSPSRNSTGISVSSPVSSYTISATRMWVVTGAERSSTSGAATMTSGSVRYQPFAPSGSGSMTVALSGGVFWILTVKSAKSLGMPVRETPRTRTVQLVSSPKVISLPVIQFSSVGCSVV